VNREFPSTELKPELRNQTEKSGQNFSPQIHRNYFRAGTNS